MTPEELIVYYRVFTQEWIENALQWTQSWVKFNKHCYVSCQRDAKAALRWIVANLTSIT